MLDHWPLVDGFRVKHRPRLPDLYRCDPVAGQTVACVRVRPSARFSVVTQLATHTES